MAPYWPFVLPSHPPKFRFGRLEHEIGLLKKGDRDGFGILNEILFSLEGIVDNFDDRVKIKNSIHSGIFSSVYDLVSFYLGAALGVEKKIQGWREER